MSTIRTKHFKSQTPLGPARRSAVTPSQSKTKTPSVSSKKKSKDEWNPYFTDNDKFKISDEEMLRRKKSLVSKNNILLNPAAETGSRKVSTPATRSLYSTPAQSRNAKPVYSNKSLAKLKKTLFTDGEDDLSDDDPPCDQWH